MDDRCETPGCEGTRWIIGIFCVTCLDRMRLDDLIQKFDQIVTSGDDSGEISVTRIAQSIKETRAFIRNG